jgi:hypothetical protein
MEKVLHDVHDLGHLEEHQNPMSRGEKLGQQAIKQFKFPRGTPKNIVADLCGVDCTLHFFENKGVVA